MDVALVKKLYGRSMTHVECEDNSGNIGFRNSLGSGCSDDSFSIKKRCTNQQNS